MSKPGVTSGISLGGVLRRPKRHPACRRREAQPGSCTERENLIGDAKGKGASGSNREAENTDAPGRGGCKIVIMVDETVDPFDLKQVMWALSTKVNPAGDLVVLPHMSILPLDPGSMPEGMTHKLIIDATTPVPPDNRGNYGQPLDSPVGTAEWREKLSKMLAESLS
jgi:hypothetical protein